MANRGGMWFILISFSTFNGFSQASAGNGDRTITLNVVAADQLQISINALQQLATAEAAKPGRKLVIWISPGWPYLSGPDIELSSTDQRNLFNEIVTISESLRKADMTIYSVDPLRTSDAVGFQTTYYENFTKGVKKPSQVQFGDVALQAIAVQSGGRVLNSSNDVAGEIASCAADANNYYVLKFQAAPADGPSEYHTLDVKIGKPGLKAITRNGYYAQP
jgi:VWFA-related protein